MAKPNEKNVKAFELSTQTRLLTEDIIKMQFLNPAVAKGVYILHDKDLDVNGDPVEPHWHIYVKLRYAQRICHIARWYDVPEQQIEHVHKWSRALKYATHSTEEAKNKYQYSDDDVKFFPDSYDWKKDREKGDTTRLDFLCEEIENGNIREYNWEEFISQKEWRKYKYQFERVFEHRRNKVIKGEKKMDVIFITGKPGVGKTTYAKEMAKRARFSYYVAGGSNDPFDGYKSQDCIILDDLRPEDYSISDLLKWTDNHTASLAKSRWNNKVINEVKLMIITSVRTIEDFYMKSMHSEPELALQLSRRVYGYAKMTKKEIIFYAFNQETEEYDEVIKLPNYTKQIIEDKKQSVDERKEFYKGLLTGISEGTKKLAENIDKYSEPEETSEPKSPQSSSGERGNKKTKK